jgi:uncharacterized membrane protein HdeD (DUF308 family)
VNWAWLFPATYVLHLAEEYWGGDGYTRHLAQTRGIHLSRLRFLILAALGFLLLIVGLILAQAFKFPQLSLVILGTVVLINGLSHTISSIRTRRYDPGLISGILIWVPLGIATLLQLKGSMHTSRYLTGVVIGLAIQGIVSLLVLSGGKHSKESPTPSS